ncbi:MAG: hypothetical protein ACJ795_06800, partial [Ktedonobacteraceae bacterium]
GHLVMQGPPRSIFTQGDTLRTWGLATPPLSELLAILRQHGIAIPPEVFTLDEAFEVLRKLYNVPGPRVQVQQEKNHV